MELKFVAPSSFIGPKFWEELYKKKMNEFKLDDSEKVLTGYYSLLEGIVRFESASLSTSHSLSFDKNHSLRSGSFINLNTVNDFSQYDKKKLITDIALKIYADIVNGSVLDDPSLLFQFAMLSFADLKLYKFTYWFCEPALVPDTSFQTTAAGISHFHNDHADHIVHLYKNLLEYWSTSPDPSFKQVLMLQTENSTPRLVSLRDGWTQRYTATSFVIVFDSALGSGDSSSSSTPDSDTTFGWSLRNVLSLLALTHNDSAEQTFVNIVSLRGQLLKRVLHAWAVGQGDGSWRGLVSDLTVADTLAADESLIFQLDLSRPYFAERPVGNSLAPASLRAVGWEPNERGRPGPRIADLSRTLDPRSLMNQAVDLNVSLMKWRLWPDLNTDVISSTKCLLFGAGTLGCAVARTLIGWGVRHVTFVDNGIVSYSNPARQCLFEFDDCVEKRAKALAAAHSLKRIFPGVNAQGIVISVPMPGHPFASAPPSGDGNTYAPSREEGDIAALDQLVQSHDVVFALTDSRESRWLPTVLAAAHKKILINCALGFDSYLVMRHGGSSPPPAELAGPKLGCYFCNDVVAAVNSQKDRTLDQQCTVTRPGLSFITAGLAVELMVSLLQSPLGPHHPAPSLSAPAPGSASNTEEEGPTIAHIPHQIRGFLSSYSQMTVTSPAFNCCTACSDPVVHEYLSRGAQFVREVCADVTGKYLEQLSGVTQLMAQVNLDDFDELDFEPFDEVVTDDGKED